MQLVVLGSGTAVPEPDRFPAGYLLRTERTHVLVDCGPGTLRRLAQAGVALEELDGVLLTHYHTDHCADLAALLFALRSPRYAGRRPLTICGAPGLVRLVGKLTEAWPWLEPRGYALDLQERTPGRWTVGEFEVEAIAIRHTAQSLGYRITADARTVAFSGDADECDALLDLARDVDLFVCDAATPDGRKLEGHLTPGLAGTYAQNAGAKRLLLTHFYPECGGADLHAQAAAAYAGSVELARDLMVLEFP